MCISWSNLIIEYSTHSSVTCVNDSICSCSLWVSIFFIVEEEVGWLALRKMISFLKLLLLLVPVLGFSYLGSSHGVAGQTLPQNEVDAINLITRKMGAIGWNFNATNTCGDRISPLKITDAERNITCNCQFPNNTCHIIGLEIKRFSLPGELPVELIRLPYLESIDFAYNYLNGTIPRELESLPLNSISLLANRLSGSIPSYLGSFTNLTYLNIELNQFSGALPRELGKLIKLRNLVLSSNKFEGNLPVELSQLSNLTDFRINDSKFNGSLPDFIGSWKQLNRLEMQASGLVGPIPPSITVLEKLTDLRISDINVTNQTFPDLSNTVGLQQLILRNCNISGGIPPYIWTFAQLKTLDLTYNKLSGELPSSILLSQALLFVFLSHNMLTGNIPIIRKGIDVDLSYNNFTRQDPQQPACQQTADINLNLFRSSSMGNDLGGACMKDSKCNQYWHSLYINCGGEALKVDGIKYEGDAIEGGGAATFYQHDDDWGLSSTGDFLNDNDDKNRANYLSLPTSNLSVLYQTARISPLSLTYYRSCLENGSYNVSLHFAEIQFTRDILYNRLGRRIFDIFIQDILVEKDFNIENQTSGVLRPITKTYNTTVDNGVLEIRLYWGGKGTSRIPFYGAYGSLISAISVKSNFKPQFASKNKKVSTAIIVVGVVVGLCLILSVIGILWWRCYRKETVRKQSDLAGVELRTISYTLRQIKLATKDFAPENKIGEGGFGPVYKGTFPNGTVVAVKQLSPKSNQGNREFLNEIGIISCMQHPNLVKLHGCCIEKAQLLLVYEYMENNSLSRALFGPDEVRIELDWQTRKRICIGIAKGLAFLHEESTHRIVHRDIKATNVLLDKDLNPKISDFGLAILDEMEKTHISTRIAGTMGYIAPEYALWGYLTYKADVYSFGILSLEIVTGKQNMSYGVDDSFSCLLDWACHLQQIGSLMELVDERLESKFNKVEAERMIKVALLCTNVSPSLRPSMSEVVGMLEGTATIPNVIPEASSYKDDLRFQAIRGHKKQLKESMEATSGMSGQSSSTGYSYNRYETYKSSSSNGAKVREEEQESQIQSQVSATFTSMEASSAALAPSVCDLKPSSI